jgi:hypothetical protein
METTRSKKKIRVKNRVRFMCYLLNPAFIAVSHNPFTGIRSWQMIPFNAGSCYKETICIRTQSTTT